MDLLVHGCIFSPLKLRNHKQFSSHTCRRAPALTVARSSNNNNEPPLPPGEGDPDLQQKLVEILRLETSKVRVSDYIDERSKLLEDIAEQAIIESDRIAADALKGLDEASAKTIKSVDEDIQAVEDQLASARAEMELRDDDLDAFEKKVEDARSEGLFFKRLYKKSSKPWKDRSPDEQKAIKQELENISRATKASLRVRSRRNLYIFLIFTLVVFLLEGIILTEVSWPRVAVYVAVIVFLSIQLILERSLTSDDDEKIKRQ